MIRDNFQNGKSIGDGKFGSMMNDGLGYRGCTAGRRIHFGQSFAGGETAQKLRTLEWLFVSRRLDGGAR
jgi:hypothetical protein